MSFTLDKIFTTALAYNPLNVGIKEAAPCDALKPYIRCFWESRADTNAGTVRIIPDYCCDILTYSSNNKNYSYFCGVNDHSFISENNVTVFGIRFYAWAAALFSSVNMENTLNCYVRANEVFSNADCLATDTLHFDSFADKIDVAQKHLIKMIDRSREKHDVMNGIFKIISNNGNTDVASLADYCAVSKRTLERNFHLLTGLSPKETIEIIRYQLLWQECLKRGFNVPDCVEKFGFYDCPHLYRNFNRFHGLSLPQALNGLKLSHFYNTL